jgi:hypothetical protein
MSTKTIAQLEADVRTAQAALDAARSSQPVAGNEYSMRVKVERVDSDNTTLLSVPADIDSGGRARLMGWFDTGAVREMIRQSNGPRQVAAEVATGLKVGNEVWVKAVIDRVDSDGTVLVNAGSIDLIGYVRNRDCFRAIPVSGIAAPAATPSRKSIEDFVRGQRVRITQVGVITAIDRSDDTVEVTFDSDEEGLRYGLDTDNYFDISVVEKVED